MFSSVLDIVRDLVPCNFNKPVVGMHLDVIQGKMTRGVRNLSLRYEVDKYDGSEWAKSLLELDVISNKSPPLFRSLLSKSELCHRGKSDKSSPKINRIHGELKFLT